MVVKIIKEMIEDEDFRFDFDKIKIGFYSKEETEKVGITMEMLSPTLVLGENTRILLTSKDMVKNNKIDVFVKLAEGKKIIYKSHHRRKYGDLTHTFNKDTVSGAESDYKSLFGEDCEEPLWTPKVRPEGLEINNKIVVTKKHIARMFGRNHIIQLLTGEGPVL